MAKDAYQEIVELMRRAAKLAHSIGIPDLLQPGLVKEIIIAKLLNHEVIPSKKDADAHEPGDPSVKYEYLSFKEGGRGQLDRMFKHPPDKRSESLRRILRNRKVYFAVFYKDFPIQVKVIYAVNPRVIREEAERKLDRSKNVISHVGFSEKWAREHGEIVYSDPKQGASRTTAS